MPDSSLQEPTRLLTDPDLDPLLRRDLEIASSHAPLRYSVDAGLSRFEQAIHGASTVPPGGSVSGMRVLGWFAGALALVGGVGYLVLARPDPGAVADGSTARANHSAVAVAPEQPAEPVATTVAPRSALADPVLADPAEPVVDPIDPVVAAPETDPDPVVAAPAVSKPKPRDPAPSSKPPASLADEAAQINAARKALVSDPAKALELTEAAEDAFPNGAMIQERRGYAILALVALGRSSEAETRADAYLERWPNGPLSRRVRDALGR